MNGSARGDAVILAQTVVADRAIRSSTPSQKATRAVSEKYSHRSWRSAQIFVRSFVSELAEQQIRIVEPRVKFGQRIFRPN
jgi:hypothetical protein